MPNFCRDMHRRFSIFAKNLGGRGLMAGPSVRAISFLEKTNKVRTQFFNGILFFGLESQWIMYKSAPQNVEIFFS